MAPRRYNSDFTRIIIESEKCVYCGEFADSIEHWPPRSCTHGGFLLSACLECNILAGVAYPLNFAKRAGYVKGKLLKRYAGILKSPHWTIDEIDQLSGRLKEQMELWRRAKLRNERRIAWNAENYIKYIDHNNDFVPLIVESSTIVLENEKSFILSARLSRS